MPVNPSAYLETVKIALFASSVLPIAERCVDVEAHPSPSRAWAGVARSAKVGGGAKTSNEGELTGANRGTVLLRGPYGCGEQDGRGETCQAGREVARGGHSRRDAARRRDRARAEATNRE